MTKTEDRKKIPVLRSNQTLLAGAIHIVGMQQLMRLVAVGLAEVILVQLLHSGILMRLALRLGLVLGVERLGAHHAGIDLHAVARGHDRLPPF